MDVFVKLVKIKTLKLWHDIKHFYLANDVMNIGRVKNGVTKKNLNEFRFYLMFLDEKKELRKGELIR